MLFEQKAWKFFHAFKKCVISLKKCLGNCFVGLDEFITNSFKSLCLLFFIHKKLIMVSEHEKSSLIFYFWLWIFTWILGSSSSEANSFFFISLSQQTVELYEKIPVYRKSCLIKIPGACTVLTYTPYNLIEVKGPWTFKKYLLPSWDVCTSKLHWGCVLKSMLH